MVIMGYHEDRLELWSLAAGENDLSACMWARSMFFHERERESSFQVTKTTYSGLQEHRIHPCIPQPQSRKFATVRLQAQVAEGGEAACMGGTGGRSHPEWGKNMANTCSWNILSRHRFAIATKRGRGQGGCRGGTVGCSPPEWQKKTLPVLSSSILLQGSPHEPERCVELLQSGAYPKRIRRLRTVDLQIHTLMQKNMSMSCLRREVGWCLSVLLSCALPLWCMSKSAPISCGVYD
jgi:hypothetical protein